MMASETINEYNGWANYPTWAINLWLDNDPGWDWSAYTSGDSLADYVRGCADEIASGAGMFSDILGWALDSVNFAEIVAAHWSDSDNVGDWLDGDIITALHPGCIEYLKGERAFAGHLLRIPNASMGDDIGREYVRSLIVARVYGRARVYVSENGGDYLRVI